MTEQGRDEYGSMPINELSYIIDSVFDSVAPEYPTNIGPESVVTVPNHAKDFAKSSARWWKHRGEYEHSNLLVFSQEEVSWSDYSGYGYYNTPNAVVSGLSVMAFSRAFQHIAAHEIGHNFGLRHRHAASDKQRTIMHPDPWGQDTELTLEFSDRSKRLIRRKLEN